MEQEPVYRYKKGEGWVLGPDNDYFECELGRYKILLEHRKPNPGERFYNVLRGSSLTVDEGINWMAVFKSLGYWDPPDFNSAVWGEFDNRGFSDAFYTHIVITIRTT